jgi:histidyl-tRNA synthetase
VILQSTEKDENIMTMSTLSSQPYKGTRDWYPEDKRVQNYIFGVWKKTAEKFGYEEYGAPLLEPIEVYAAKSGQELVGEQTYRFIDRGDREVAIRPEMTPTISRMVAARRQELAYPARLFSIANFMRYERPQKGREREFWQLNVDLFGADTIYADAEIISFSSMVMKEFGASEEMFTIRINDRRVISATMHEYLGLDEVQAQLMTKLFDRKSKVSPEDFRDQAIEIFGEEKAPAGLQKIAELINAKSVDSLPKELQAIEAMASVSTLFDILKDAGVKNAVFDITLMRGLDYYTGTVFEFFDNDPENNRSLFGGGRYDGLVGLFGAEPISAVGVAPGLTTTEIFLRLHGLLPKLAPSTEVYLVILSEDTLDDALVLARKWREEGLAVEVDITGRKLDKQIKTAVKKRIPFMVFIGENELKNDIYTLKDVASAEEQQLSFERVVSVVKDRRRSNSDIDEIDSLLD